MGAHDPLDDEDDEGDREARVDDVEDAFQAAGQGEEGVAGGRREPSMESSSICCPLLSPLVAVAAPELHVEAFVILKAASVLRPPPSMSREVKGPVVVELVDVAGLAEAEDGHGEVATVGGVEGEAQPVADVPKARPDESPVRAVQPWSGAPLSVHPRGREGREGREGSGPRWYSAMGVSVMRAMLGVLLWTSRRASSVVAQNVASPPPTQPSICPSICLEPARPSVVIRQVRGRELVDVIGVLPEEVLHLGAADEGELDGVLDDELLEAARAGDGHVAGEVRRTC